MRKIGSLFGAGEDGAHVGPVADAWDGACATTVADDEGEVDRGQGGKTNTLRARSAMKPWDVRGWM